MKLNRKIAVITGADSGIGQATAEAFAREGADISILYHSDAEGAAETQRWVEAAGRSAHVMQGDVVLQDLFRRCLKPPCRSLAFRTC